MISKKGHRKSTSRKKSSKKNRSNSPINLESYKFEEKNKNNNNITPIALPLNENNDASLTRLPRSFFTVEVTTLAKSLLNQILVYKAGDVIYKFKIVETEAYKGPLDKACHAYNNKRTERTKYFYQNGGNLYVFMIYGHCLLNITAGNESEPEAVLIRAMEPVNNFKEILAKRNVKNLYDVANGPGKIGDCLDLKLDDNGRDLCVDEFLYMEKGDDLKAEDLGVSERINIDYAEEWKDVMWRFFIKGNKFVSKVKLKK